MDDGQVVGNHVQETRKVGNIFDFSQSSAIFSSEKHKWETEQIETCLHL